MPSPSSRCETVRARLIDAIHAAHLIANSAAQPTALDFLAATKSGERALLLAEFRKAQAAATFLDPSRILDIFLASCAESLDLPPCGEGVLVHWRRSGITFFRQFGSFESRGSCQLQLRVGLGSGTAGRDIAEGSRWSGDLGDMTAFRAALTADPAFAMLLTARAHGLSVWVLDWPEAEASAQATGAVPHPSPSSEHVVRQYSLDNQLIDEFPRRNGSVTGLWRQWYPDGQLKGEWWLDRDVYMNGTNRTWHPNGVLANELVYKGVELIEERWFDDRGRRIPSPMEQYAEAERRDVRKAIAKARAAAPASKPIQPSRQTLKRDQDRAQSLLYSRPAEAREWIAPASPERPRIVGDFDQELSAEFINAMYELGALRVHAAEIDPKPGSAREDCCQFYIELPDDPAARVRLFTFARAIARMQGLNGERDRGQRLLFVWLD